MITQVAIERLYPEMEEATVGAWFKREGDRVAAGDMLAEIITDKVAFELEAEYPGVVRRLLVKEKSVVPVGFVIALIGEPTDELPEVEQQNHQLLEAREQALRAAPRVPTKAKELETARPARAFRATPAARRVARDHNVDLGEVVGTGPEGVITEADVRAMLKE